jgi:hypothetical protein
MRFRPCCAPADARAASAGLRRRRLVSCAGFVQIWRFPDRDLESAGQADGQVPLRILRAACVLVQTATKGETMIQISYLSSATEPLSTEQLLALLQQCLAHNTGSGVTGMLLYGNATFLQVLEGEAQVIDALYDKIKKDPRHAHILFLHRKTIERRQYQDWSMGFKRISDKDLQRIEGLRDFSAKDFNADYLGRHAAVVDRLIEAYSAPFWDPLVRELDEKEKVIEHLNKTLAQARGAAEIAGLVLESVVEASGKGSLSDGHVRLCELALDSLRQI